MHRPSTATTAPAGARVEAPFKLPSPRTDGLTVTSPALSGDGAHEQIAAVDAGTAVAIAAARDHVCQHIASDRAKGYGPFHARGIAGQGVDSL